MAEALEEEGFCGEEAIIAAIDDFGFECVESEEVVISEGVLLVVLEDFTNGGEGFVEPGVAAIGEGEVEAGYGAGICGGHLVGTMEFGDGLANEAQLLIVEQLAAEIEAGGRVIDRAVDTDELIPAAVAFAEDLVGIFSVERGGLVFGAGLERLEVDFCGPVIGVELEGEAEEFFDGVLLAIAGAEEGDGPEVEGLGVPAGDCSCVGGFLGGGGE